MSRLTVHREIEGKQHCDLCGGDGPVFEISVPYQKSGKSPKSTGKAYWFDVCRRCIKRHKDGGGIIGPLGFVRGLAGVLRGTGRAD